MDDDAAAERATATMRDCNLDFMTLGMAGLLICFQGCCGNANENMDDLLVE
jgi:hypothetical protein